ncbi:MAG: hypothetical protein ABGW77_03075 [Campylobacterales bacterium]
MEWEKVLIEMERLRQEANWAQWERRRLEGEVTQLRGVIEGLEREINRNFTALQQAYREVEEVKKEISRFGEGVRVVPLFRKLKEYWEGVQLIGEGVGLLPEKRAEILTGLEEIGWELELGRLFGLEQFPVVWVVGEVGELKLFLKEILGEERGEDIVGGWRGKVPLLLGPLPEEGEPLLIWREGRGAGTLQQAPQTIEEQKLGKDFLFKLAPFFWRVLIPSPIKLNLFFFSLPTPDEERVEHLFQRPLPGGIIFSSYSPELGGVIKKVLKERKNSPYPVEIFEVDFKRKLEGDGKFSRRSFNSNFFIGGEIGIVGELLQKWERELSPAGELLESQLRESEKKVTGSTSDSTIFNQLMELVQQVRVEMLNSQTPPPPSLDQLELVLLEDILTHSSIESDLFLKGWELIWRGIEGE